MDKRLKPHTEQVIDEYLAVTKSCIESQRPNGAIWGYPAALLLFCATDAIGRGVGAEGGKKARLGVLNYPEFGLGLSDGQIKLLRDVYRDPLTHNGQLGYGAQMLPDKVGHAFEFPTGGQVLVRVPVFL